MAKLYTQIVLACSECPRLRFGGWCTALRRQLYPLPQVPPKDCPLPDAVQATPEASQASEVRG